VLASGLCAATLTTSDRACARLAAPGSLPESDTPTSETASNAKSSSGAQPDQSFGEQSYHDLSRQDAAQWADLGTYRA
jgi:hypothetical protein